MFSVSKTVRNGTVMRQSGSSQGASENAHPDFPNSLIDGAHISAITQSRDRCRALGLRDSERPDHSPINRSDFTIARDRSMRLFRHAAPIMEILYEQIINTHSMVILTDDQGTILHGIGDNDFLAKAEKVALLPGVNWAENKKGTNGMGTALMDERPTLVHAGEHYLSANHFLTCSAAPIFDPRGDLLGVLDVTSDHRSYHQHTMGLVKMSARMIENDWFSDNFREALRLYIHTRAEFLGTLMQGILAISRDGRILGANRCAVEMLGMSPAALRMHSLSSLLGTALGTVVDHAKLYSYTNHEPMTVSTANGLVLRARAELSWAPVLTASGSNSKLDADDKLPLRPTSALLGSHEPHDAVQATTQLAAKALPPMITRKASALQALNTGDAHLSALLDKAQRVLNTNIPVLILGETGSGKEWLARALHADSARTAQAFVSVNCASIPDAMIESELFGSDDAATQGAGGHASLGKLLQANGGTLFLDEIGDMSLAMQTIMLRVLQDRQFTPLSNGGRPVELDVMLICATQRDLRSLLDKHAFREDLYYRLNGLSIRMPALRQRSDMPLLISQMLAQLGIEGASRHTQNIQNGTGNLSLSAEVMQLFEGYSWPGNLRQLSNVLRAAAAMAARSGVITKDHLPDDFVEEATIALSVSRSDGSMANALNIQAADVQPTTSTSALSPQTLHEMELASIRAALDAAGGNISVASKKLGISRNTIYRKLKWNADKAH